MGKTLAICMTASALLLASCFRQPAFYSIPDQYSAPPPPAGSLFLDMGDPDIKQHTLRDVWNLEPGDLVAWTAHSPAFRFRPASVHALTFYMRYAVHDRTFHDTGPVTLTISLNDVRIDHFRVNASGIYDYEHTVPRELIQAGADLNLSIVVDPVWISPDDKAPLGIVLQAIGFYEP